MEGRARYSALIGRELASDKRTTDMMAQSRAFAGGFAAERFRVLAQRLVARQLDWRRIRVSDVAGQTLLSVPELQPGTGANGVVDREIFGWAIHRQLPDIGRVVTGRNGAYAFPIRAPVVRGGKTLYVVTTLVPATM